MKWHNWSAVEQICEYEYKCNQDKTISAPPNEKSCTFSFLASTSWTGQFKFWSSKNGILGLETWKQYVRPSYDRWTSCNNWHFEHYLKAYVDWTLNVLAMPRDWNALPFVGTVGEQKPWKLAKLCQMMMLDMKNLTVTMKICSNVFLDYDDYPFSKLFNNVMTKWLRFLQLH